MADLNDKSANFSIVNNNKSKTVTITTDGANERLDTDARVSNDASDPVIATLVNTNGDVIESHEDTDGEHYLGVAMIQAVHVIPANSSTSNLTAGATFTGTSTSTLGVVGIQVTLKTDQNCSIFVDQSPDGTNWDIVDGFTYMAGEGFGRTLQAVNSYVRVRVTNTSGGSTTYFRLQTVLCPVSIPEAFLRYRNLSGAGTTTIKSGRGKLYTILNNAGIGTAVVYDNTAGSGTTIGTLTFSNNQNFDYRGIAFTTGLTVVQSGASSNTTIIYE